MHCGTKSPLSNFPNAKSLIPPVIFFLHKCAKQIRNQYSMSDFSQLCWQLLLDLHNQPKQLLMNSLCKNAKSDPTCDTITHTQRKYIEDYWIINIFRFTPPVYKDKTGCFRMAIKVPNGTPPVEQRTRTTFTTHICWLMWLRLKDKNTYTIQNTPKFIYHKLE